MVLAKEEQRKTSVSPRKSTPEATALEKPTDNSENKAEIR